MTRPSGNLFSVPPNRPFLETLARSVLNGVVPGIGGEAPDPFDLAVYEIYLPNREACRRLAQTFLDLSPHRATLLPRIRPLGSTEEDALRLLQVDAFEASGRSDSAIPPAIHALDRRLTLAELILAWSRQLSAGGVFGEPGLRIADTPTAASEMALDLMRLMDEAETEGVDLRDLAALLPEEFASYEQLTLNFLNIVIEAWPAILAERTLLNPASRRNRLMALECERLLRGNPETPVIIGGSTGSIPATAALMQTVLTLPNGAIVLPGIDFSLDDESWNAIDQHPEHPQAGLHSLVALLGKTRADITELERNALTTAEKTRITLISEAARPASTLARWPAFIQSAQQADIAEAVRKVSLIEAPDEQDEAAIIAMILRDVLETPDKTANLVTPDQALQRRVTAELGRWSIDIVSNDGEPLRTTLAGRFYELIADYAAGGDQIGLLSLLKHPLCRLGLSAEACANAARKLEMAAMRQPWCGNGIRSLITSLELAEKSRRGADADEDWDTLFDFTSRIRTALAPLMEIGKAGAKVSIARLATAHMASARAFAADETDSDPVPDGLSGAETMATAVLALANNVGGPEIALEDYPALLNSLIKLERTPPGKSSGGRLQILNAMQSRFSSADLIIVAGLNDGCWPENDDPGPWLNRATREMLGLPPPEQKTRLAAHDFCQLLAAPEVIMTRAFKSEGTPAVPSRWLLRLQTLLNGLGLANALAPEKPWLQWIAARNDVPPPRAASPPAPRPPLEARPRSLTVSNIETLIANPYAIYASEILGLRPLIPLHTEAGGAERGQIIHDVLHLFTRRYGSELPVDSAAEIMRIFDWLTAQYGDQAHIRAFWRPRLERFAAWFAETEAERRGNARTLSEVRGGYSFIAPGGEFHLRARADRIDIHEDDTLAIYDYKSGAMPAEKAVAAFKAPQMPLEALIALEGGFEGVGKARVTRLAYISARGADPAGEQLTLGEAADRLAEGAREGLTQLIARYDDPSTPYSALRRTIFASAYRYDAYAHLARAAEWADAEDGET